VAAARVEAHVDGEGWCGRRGRKDRVDFHEGTVGVGGREGRKGGRRGLGSPVVSGLMREWGLGGKQHAHTVSVIISSC
jgi:hypothetical protein